MKVYQIPEDHLLRLIDICSKENSCLKGDVDCVCQREYKNKEIKDIKKMEANIPTNL